MTDIDIENYPLDGESILLDQITCYVEGLCIVNLLLTNSHKI